MLGRKRKKPQSKKNLAENVETRRPPQKRPDDLEALRFLDSLVAKAPVNRQTHVMAQDAYQQLTRALQRLDAFMSKKPLGGQDKKKPDEQPEEKPDEQHPKGKD